MTLQEAFDKLFAVSEKACEAEVSSEEECARAMTKLWDTLREVKSFYTDASY